MQVVEIDRRDKQLISQFIDLPSRIYQNTPQWVPPLPWDARQPFDRRGFPFYQHGDAVFLLVVDGDRSLGRLAVLENRRYNDFNDQRSAFFYLFECENDKQAAHALFDFAYEWASQRGLDRIFGPKGFTVFDGIGMLVEGFEFRPAFGQPYNLPYYPALVENAGFQTESELVTGYMNEEIEFPEKILRISDQIQKRRGLYIARCRTRGELRIVLSKLKEIYNASLGGTRGNIPLTDDEINSLANQMLWFADPKLVKIVMKEDTPVGFLLAYPDISAALQKTKGRIFPFGWLTLLIELQRTKWININGAGISSQYRGVGGTAILFSEMYKSVVDSRYRHADIVQIGTDNENMQREMRSFGIDFYKTHRIYSRSL